MAIGAMAEKSIGFIAKIVFRVNREYWRNASQDSVTIRVLLMLTIAKVTVHSI